MKTITVKAHNQVGTIAEHSVVTQDGVPTVIQATNKINYELFDEAAGQAPRNIVTQRVNKDLHVSFEAEGVNPDLIIEGFYNVDNALMEVAADGSYYYYVPHTGEVADVVTELQPGDIEGQTLGGEPQGTPWWVSATDGFDAVPWLLGLAGAGVAGAALSGGSDGNEDDSNDNTDTTAPTAPSIVINEEGTVISGNAELGSRVEIDVNGDGDPDYTVEADAETGGFTVDTSDTPLVDGETITATATDDAGNESEPTTIMATDTTAPTAPSVVINEEGTVISGTAEPGSSVEIDVNGDGDPDYTVEADAETGGFTVDTSDTPLVDGETITATATDDAGNESEPTTIMATDTTAPTAPSVMIGDGDDTVDGFDLNANGDVTVSVTLPEDAKIGDTVTVNGTTETMITQAMLDDGYDTTVMAPEEGETLTVTVTVTDQAGNSSEPGEATATVGDITAPTAPSIVINEEGTVISGTAEPGSSIEIDVNGDGEPDYTVEADAETGDFTVDTSDTPLVDGETITATATDDAGNESEPTTITAMDTTAPEAPLAAPVITDNVDGNGDVLDPAETIPDDGITNDNTPSVTVPADQVANGTPQLVVNGDVVASTPVTNADGSVTLTPVDALEDDSYEISYNLIDEAGNVSEASPATTITVDTVAPGGEVEAAIAAPVIAIAEAIDGINATEFTDGVQTQVTLPTGTVAGDTVTLTVTLAGGDPITVDYVVTADDLDVDGGNGVADVTIANDMAAGITADGTYSVTATVTDAAGNVSAPSDAASFTVDTTAPEAPLAAPVITDNVDGNGDVLDPAETIPDDGITNDNTPSVTVPADQVANGTPQLVVNGDVVASTPVTNADGSVTLTPVDALEDDSYEISYNLIDEAGNVSEASPATTITVDTVAPGGEVEAAIAAPVIAIAEAIDGINATEFTDGVQTQVTLPTGTVAGDMVTLTVTLAGGDPITVDYVVTADDLDVDGGNGVADVTIANDMAAGITADGTYSVTATVTDAAGNVSAPSDAASFTVDTTAPEAPLAAPVITDNVDGNGDVLDPAETIPDDGITNDNTPSVTVPADQVANGTPQLVVNGDVVASTPVTNADGSVTLTPVDALEDDSYEISYNLIDEAGNVSEASPATTITVDTVAPGGEVEAAIAAPVIAIAEAIDGINATEFTDGVQTQVTLPTGTVAGDMVTLTVTLAGGDPITVDYVVTADDLDVDGGNGVADVTIANDMAAGITADGTYSVTATVTDAAGNVSAPSDAASFTVDTTAPEAPLAAPVITDNVDGNGDVLDPAETIPDGGITNDNTPSVTVPADQVANGTPQLVVNGDVVASTPVTNADGSVTLTPVDALEDDSYEISYNLIDEAGNVSEASPATTITVDTVAPGGEVEAAIAAPVIAIAEAIDGINATEFTDGVQTQVTLPTGTVAGDMVTLTVTLAGGDPITVDYVVTADDLDVDGGNGVADVTIANDMAAGITADGTYSVTATVTDAAGNVSAPSDAASFTVDTTAPEAPLAAPVITDNVDGNGDVLDPAETIPDGGITNDNTPSVTVPADQVANGTPQLVVNGDVVASTPVTNADGSVTLTPVDALEDDSYEISYNLIDEAGNVSEASPATTITVDTVAPGGEVEAAIAAPVIAIAEAIDGINATEFTDGVQTQVTLPTGTVAGDTVTLTVTLAGGDPITVDYVVTADDLDVDGGNGVADVTIANDMAAGITADGTYSVTATVTDAAGNVSAPSDAASFTVDTTAPEAPLAAPVITDNVDGNGDVLDPAETIPDDGITNDNTPSVTVPADQVANGTPQLVVNGDVVASTPVTNADGSVTLTPVDALEDDSYEISYNLIDEAGNVSEASPATTITVDTVAPGGEVEAAIAAPVIAIAEAIDGINATEFTDGVQTQVTLPTGTVAGDMVTLTVTLAGGDPITVDYVVTADDLDVDGGNGVADVTIANDMAAGITADGTYSVTATVTDAAGNVSAPSDAASFTVDTTAPEAPLAAPVITDNVDGNGDVLDPAETIPDGGITNDNTPSVTVPADQVANGTPQLVVNGDVVASTPVTNADGSVTLTPVDALEDDSYEISYNLIDEAGNVSEASPATTITVDTVAPGGEVEAAIAAPVIAIAEAIDGINATEFTDGVQTQVTLPTGTVAGDTVTLTVTLAGGDPITVDYVVTADDLDVDGGNGVADVTIANDMAAGITADGTYSVTATVTDAAGNVSAPSAAVDFTVDTVAPGGEVGAEIAAPVIAIAEAIDGINATEFTDGVQTQITLPTGTVAGDMITLTVTSDDGDPITVEYEVTADDLDVDGGDGVAEVTIPNGVDGISDNGAYTVVATVTDVNENVSAPSAAVEFDLNTTFTARDDLDDLELGALQVTYYDPISESDLDVLGVAEGTDGADSSLGFTVSAGASGTVNIEVSQTALVTVADAINIEVYNSNNELVYVGTTGGDPLVGNVIGIELLGLTGNDTLTATVSGLEPDNYTIVVRNSESALGALVNGLTLAELGEAGVVLGPDNQEVVFTTIDNALGPVLGGTVNGLLNIALTAAGDEGLGLDAVVDILEDNVLGLGLLDPLLDDITAVLLSNTLTLLETTDITATVTEFDYADDTVITGNVIDPDISSSGELGEDTVTVDTVLTNIGSNDSQSEPTSAVVNGTTVFTIQGQYGVLVIDENGDYTYTANGDFASLGQSETFTYTVSDGVISDTAELVIELDDLTPPNAPTIDTPIAGDDVVNSQEAADGFNITGTGEIGSTITLTDETGDVIGTATVDANGNWSVLVDQSNVDAMDQGAETITVVATDPSGNVSSSVIAAIDVDTVSPTAIDDRNSAELEVTSTTSTSTAELSGRFNSVLSVGVLNDAIDIGVLESNSIFAVDLPAGSTQTITVDGSGSQLLSLSALLGGNNDFNLEIYRQESGSDTAELVQLEEGFLDYNPGIAGLLGGWSATPLQLDTFNGGANGAKYFVVATNPAADDGLLSLGAVASLQITTTRSLRTDYSATTLTVDGNVIANDDGNGQVITVTTVNGDPVDGSVTIIGDYGTLVIDSSGAYTYTANTNINGISKTDEFEYTIDDGNGNVDTATLSINITSDDYSPPAARMSASSFTLADDTDDAIELPDTSFITSTEGLDILSFDGADQVISLSDLIQPEVLDTIDISGIGANTLNIAANDVDSTIYVRGDSDDTVNLEGDSWSNVGQTTLEGEVYNVWQSGNDISNQVHIDTDITNII